MNEGIDLSGLVDGYLEESEELLDDAEQALLDMEADPSNKDAIEDAVDAALRSIHTVKGNALGLGFDAIGEVGHAMEELLDRYRKGRGTPKTREIDQLFAGIDHLRHLLSSESEREEPSDMLLEYVRGLSQPDPAALGGPTFDQSADQSYLDAGPDIEIAPPTNKIEDDGSDVNPAAAPTSPTAWKWTQVGRPALDGDSQARSDSSEEAAAPSHATDHLEIGPVEYLSGVPSGQDPDHADDTEDPIRFGWIEDPIVRPTELEEVDAVGEESGEQAGQVTASHPAPDHIAAVDRSAAHTEPVEATTDEPRSVTSNNHPQPDDDLLAELTQLATDSELARSASTHKDAALMGSEPEASAPISEEPQPILDHIVSSAPALEPGGAEPKRSAPASSAPKHEGVHPAGAIDKVPAVPEPLTTEQNPPRPDDNGSVELVPDVKDDNQDEGRLDDRPSSDTPDGSSEFAGEIFDPDQVPGNDVSGLEAFTALYDPSAPWVNPDGRQSSRHKSQDEADRAGRFFGVERWLDDAENDRSGSTEATDLGVTDSTQDAAAQDAAVVSVPTDDRPVLSTESSGTIRVATEKLDSLLSLTAELTIAHGRLRSLIERHDLPFEIQEALSADEALMFGLQELVMRTRMVRIGSMFQSLARTVRDACRDMGVEAELVIKGAEVEVDNRVIEKVRDPLMHMLRNAIAHGIESHEDRERLGKSPIGKIVLSAQHDGGQLVVTVSDDGRGLDTDAIRRHASAEGLIRPEVHLTDAALHNLIFLPGFSTAESVTELSGRGVGMNVVRENIDSLRGTVNVDSRPGIGTSITVRLPLTVSIIDGITVQVAGDLFVVPLDSVIEVLPVPETVEVGRRHGIMRLREDVIPWIRLRSVFGYDFEHGAERMVIVRHGDRAAGLIVDNIEGDRQSVITPLGKVLETVDGIAGSSLIETGDIALVLDVKTLLDQELAHA